MDILRDLKNEDEVNNIQKKKEKNMTVNYVKKKRN